MLQLFQNPYDVCKIYNYNLYELRNVVFFTGSATI